MDWQRRTTCVAYLSTVNPFLGDLFSGRKPQLHTYFIPSMRQQVGWVTFSSRGPINFVEKAFRAFAHCCSSDLLRLQRERNALSRLRASSDQPLGRRADPENYFTRSKAKALCEIGVKHPHRLVNAALTIGQLSKLARRRGINFVEAPVPCTVRRAEDGSFVPRHLNVDNTIFYPYCDNVFFFLVCQTFNGPRSTANNINQ